MMYKSILSIIAALIFISSACSTESIDKQEIQKGNVIFIHPDCTGTPPFISKPDQFGNRFPFGIHRSTKSDAYGSVVVRSTGINSFLTKGLVDNTDIYRIMYASLFGTQLD